jgi:Terminase-like family.
VSFDLSSIKNEKEIYTNQLGDIIKTSNQINGTPLDDYIFNKLLTKVDPIEYCQRVLRAHLPPKKQKLHENQIELIRAVCNPKIRSVAALMARQAGKTESIASFTGYLLDNYPGMRVGIFTPRIQQAEINLGRTAVFFQMNEDKLNNKIVKCNKQRIELSNGSFAMAVSGSDQSNIEGLTFDVIVLDEAQKISNYTVSERIVPMG